MELLQQHIAPGAFHNSEERYDPSSTYTDCGFEEDNGLGEGSK